MPVEGWEWLYKYGVNNAQVYRWGRFKLYGCHYCCKIFRGWKITEWVKERMDKDKRYSIAERKSTAMCPYCRIDAVVLIKDFLDEARRVTFGR